MTPSEKADILKSLYEIRNALNEIKAGLEEAVKRGGV
jgi:hypothetical protein